MILRRCKKILLASLLLLAGSQLAELTWIQAKARLAQHFMMAAWQQSLVIKQPVKAWPWADTWPIAQLHYADRDWLVLAGDHGEALAFGPGHVGSSIKPGYPGTSVVAGHRDTHFGFLQRLQLGEELAITNDIGAMSRYRVAQMAVVDTAQQVLSLQPDLDRLVLVTCYPFDAIDSNGSLRFVVVANALKDLALAAPLPNRYQL